MLANINSVCLVNNPALLSRVTIAKESQFIVNIAVKLAGGLSFFINTSLLLVLIYFSKI